VEIARDGAAIAPGCCWLAPPDRHLRLVAGRRFRLDDDAPRGGGHRPSVDVLFESAARLCGDRTLAILLTGMGRDGARGLGTVARAGGLTIAQDAASCVVFGMPAAAIALGHAGRILPLAAIAPAILEAFAGRPPGASPGRQTDE
jgi:two-component system chemotaxis response regulator CheB